MQCLPCRINGRRVWAARMEFEARCHAESCFVTLTYDPAHLPEGGTLVPRDLKLFLMRLRKRLDPLRWRYFAVGEYGEQSGRPHYHLNLFGLGLGISADIRACWQKGNSLVLPFQVGAAQYVAGYVTKKMTRPEDPRLSGRHPEFARMSLKPGIGSGVVPILAQALSDVHGARLISATGDVPTHLQIGGKSAPLGRYLRRKVREELGFDDVGGQEAQKRIRAAEVQSVLEASGSVSAYLSSKESTSRQRRLQMTTKAKIFAKKESV